MYSLVSPLLGPCFYLKMTNNPPTPSKISIDGFYSLDKIRICLVEARGVEPLSRSVAIQVSPSAVVNLGFALLPPNDRLRQRYLDKVSLWVLRELDFRYPALWRDSFPAGGRNWPVSIKLLKRILRWQLKLSHRLTGRWNPGSLPIPQPPLSKTSTPPDYNEVIMIN